MAPMGIGVLGEPGIIIKRKFRFTVQIDTPLGTVPIHFVKISARPQLEIEETEINFRNAVTWIPGKGKWQPLTLTYYDVANTNLMKPLWDWLASIYDFVNPQNLFQTEKAGWSSIVIIQMFDGCGSPLERWELREAWPTSINFGDLDYGVSEDATIELTLRYSQARYTGVCGPSPSPICIGC